MPRRSRAPETGQCPECGHCPESGQCLETDADRLRALTERVGQKLQDAGGYDFKLDELRMLGIFFELGQELDRQRDFLSLCALLPLLCFGQEVRVYLRTAPGSWRLARSLRDPAAGGEPLPTKEPPPWSTTQGRHFYAPIKARRDTEELVGFPLENGVLGWIEVLNGAELAGARQLFYEIYAGRVGQQMHNRLSRAKNREHLAFIQNLVADIGHNVIVPNMSFKLFFNHLRGSIHTLQDMLAHAPESTPPEFLGGLLALGERMGRQYEEISRHYEQTSLFLETLLRRRHFEEGRYVLERRRVDLLRQVVGPQLDRYRPRLADKGIEVVLAPQQDGPDETPDSPPALLADPGLLAQVYANLFSNALKYTRPAITPGGMANRVVCGWRRVPDCFGPGRDGLRLTVATTGQPIPQDERDRLFQPGFRASTTGAEHGTGHGLAFIKQVVDLHGGRVGYEATQEGNAFSLVLPVADAEDSQP